MSYDALFSPIKLRGLELKNRVVLPGMNTKMVKDKNDVGEDLPAYHAARAAGGCGLNIVELVSICPECHAYLYLGLYNEHHRDQLARSPTRSTRPAAKQACRSGTAASCPKSSSTRPTSSRRLTR